MNTFSAIPEEYQLLGHKIISAYEVVTMITDTDDRRFFFLLSPLFTFRSTLWSHSAEIAFHIQLTPTSRFSPFPLSSRCTYYPLITAIEQDSLESCKETQIYGRLWASLERLSGSVAYRNIKRPQVTVPALSYLTLIFQRVPRKLWQRKKQIKILMGQERSPCYIMIPFNSVEINLRAEPTTVL